MRTMPPNPTKLKKLWYRVKKYEKNDFWALKDISFEVRKGDRLAIVGRNGAGKSTMLKLISRITEPTEGRIEYYGRVAAMLEVGTGFNGELTGRENVYLNGALLGFSNEEMDAMYDDIWKFAELEQFQDQKLKNYSSGILNRAGISILSVIQLLVLIGRFAG